MQSVVSRMAFTFVDDSCALVKGAARILRDLAVDGLTAMRTTAMAPVDRIARASDVAGVLSAREAAAPPAGPRRPRLSREKTLALRARSERGGRSGAFGIFSSLRALSNLT